MTSTPTITPTITFTPTATPSFTPTVPVVDDFYIDHNLYNPTTDQPVSIHVAYNRYPGNYSLRIYNSAGEHIRTLDDLGMTAPIDRSYQWDGKNKYDADCASGVYIFYLVEPFGTKLKKVILVR
jgi:flagellar hook assembly protein FlgD